MVRYFAPLIIALAIAGACFGQCSPPVVDLGDGQWQSQKIIQETQCPGGNCSGGTCPLPNSPSDWRPSQRPPGYNVPERNMPRLAWRYEQHKGKYGPVVRVIGKAGAVSYKGSGCVIRWGRRVVVVTAAHVVRGVSKIFVRGKTKYHECTLIGVDRTFDVAILEPASKTDFAITEIAWEGSGTLKQGDGVESCGFGPDDRLAVNGGRILSFKRPTGSNAPDWIELSGPAREGDSGGPVLNAQGELVGVLWGTSGSTVVATQCGRLHEIINRLAGPYAVEKQHTIIEHPVVPVTPTGSAGVQVGLFGGREGGGLLPLCPPRKPKAPEPAPPPNVIVNADPRVGDSLERIDSKLDTIAINTAPPVPPNEADKPKEPLPLFAVLAAVAGVVIGFVVYFAAQKGN